jgi:hypothetical protein
MEIMVWKLLVIIIFTTIGYFGTEFLIKKLSASKKDGK